MDTSKTYVKMCDCPEIQEQWISEAGDFYFARDSRFRPLSSVINIYDDMGWALLPRDVNYGWLPRQDQIQEMILKKFSEEVFVLKDSHDGAKLVYLIGTFKDFVHIKCEKMIPLEKNRARIEYFFDSMEQLWLAFYMHEKHGKLWGGEKWGKK